MPLSQGHLMVVSNLPEGIKNLIVGIGLYKERGRTILVSSKAKETAKQGDATCVL